MTTRHDVRRRLLTAATASVLALGLAACGEDTEPSPGGTTTPPVGTEPTTEPGSATPTEDATTTAPTGEPSGEETDQSALPPFEPAGTPRTSEPSGDLLLPVDLRVGDHEGYERVVIDLEGVGVPGWQTEYVTEAIEDGRGERVDVAGDAILSVYVSGTRYPHEGEAHYVSQGPVDGSDVIEEVHYLGTFEGLTQLFIGVDGGPADYRVLTLSNPARLVIDIAED
ncbi:hypothetical protein FHE66_08495 [Georgenia sp. 311]|uniref:AMIN-like domain-containing (lipo)protein n=1 Tax=Georgenia sp. 311 TaxID=2585134 RepID=UPI00111204B7|nr:hypothetical protein [Georgenia sp. 311]TNC18026.1 hypothetical protein FHE66_08495 [Georgenia sp. 311]